MTSVIKGKRTLVVKLEWNPKGAQSGDGPTLNRSLIDSIFITNKKTYKLNNYFNYERK